jgi:hypothetical protein
MADANHACLPSWRDSKPHRKLSGSSTCSHLPKSKPYKTWYHTLNGQRKVLQQNEGNRTKRSMLYQHILRKEKRKWCALQSDVAILSHKHLDVSRIIPDCKTSSVAILETTLGKGTDNREFVDEIFHRVTTAL